MTSMAKVFKNGGSQAIRLPKEFRFDADEVCVKRIGTALLVFPKGEAWNLMRGAFGSAPDFPGRGQPRKPQKRKRL